MLVNIDQLWCRMMGSNHGHDSNIFGRLELSRIDESQVDYCKDVDVDKEEMFDRMDRQAVKAVQEGSNREWVSSDAAHYHIGYPLFIMLL